MTDITIPGIMLGQTIQLTGSHELPLGQRVEVTIKVVDAPARTGEGLLRCAGGMAPYWSDEDDRVLEEIHNDRKRTTLRDLPE